MKKEQEELKVVFTNELDLSKVPKDIFDTFLEALMDAIEELGEENNLLKG